MCGVIMMGILLYLGIVGGFSVVSFAAGSAYEAGGIWGILGFVAWIFFLMWIASIIGDGKGKKK